MPKSKSLKDAVAAPAAPKKRTSAAPVQKKSSANRLALTIVTALIAGMLGGALSSRFLRFLRF